jgi:hypothetical protein
VDDIEQVWDVLGGWTERIFKETVNIYHRRVVYESMLEMLREQNHPDAGLFFETYNDQYIEAQAMAIRRQADDNDRTVSLRRLLRRLDRHRAFITREWYHDRMLRPSDGHEDWRGDEFHQYVTDNRFDVFTKRAGDSKLWRKRILDDIKSLVAASETVVDYANTNIAHLQIDEPSTVTYDEFNDAINSLGALAQRYYSFVHGSSLPSLTPTVEGDWRGPFRSPLAFDHHQDEGPLEGDG